MRNENLKMLIVTALFAAIIGIMAQITIPLPLVPITGQTLAIGLAATILGKRYGTLSVLVYILLGVVGVPVFSMMESGLGVVFGPRGGYILGFIPAAFIIGWYIERLGLTMTHAVIANIIGMIITLTCGAVWLKFSAELSWMAALTGGVTPFLIIGVVKAVLAAFIGILVRKRLSSAKLLPASIA
ncbi:biotin transporter BioY [Paenisporosarcina indica]|uniref:biotin transporter BioY n=1 Tax=Paenisporosarcina indica TaxID=650093 RepID=UPI00094FCD30|nr:biotin transporter BioY [Paenisporosarcina indica]